ncbi:uncharacterized protein CLUP02_03817 [Colletotrichum lupini]|uniref:Uncharacterized protein n=1 Tax=Colletotrichum lupini TaxID=145971 RepID=A0A9Q8SK19_9PEZI|nr:uncharacterized protein CLUP02_03817 [Colletotrichum lupini]UQC78340.1 hypothetical protein CLUP02_03817 [Colletotrichum lupini]
MQWPSRDAANAIPAHRCLTSTPALRHGLSPTPSCTHTNYDFLSGLTSRNSRLLSSTENGQSGKRLDEFGTGSRISHQTGVRVAKRCHRMESVHRLVVPVANLPSSVANSDLERPTSSTYLRYSGLWPIRAFNLRAIAAVLLSLQTVGSGAHGGFLAGRTTTRVSVRPHLAVFGLVQALYARRCVPPMSGIVHALLGLPPVGMSSCGIGWDGGVSVRELLTLEHTLPPGWHLPHLIRLRTREGRKWRFNLVLLSPLAQLHKYPYGYPDHIPPRVYAHPFFFAFSYGTQTDTSSPYYCGSPVPGSFNLQVPPGLTSYFSALVCAASLLKPPLACGTLLLARTPQLAVTYHGNNRDTLKSPNSDHYERYGTRRQARLASALQVHPSSKIHLSPRASNSSRAFTLHCSNSRIHFPRVGLGSIANAFLLAALLSPPFLLPSITFFLVYSPFYTSPFPPRDIVRLENKEDFEVRPGAQSRELIDLFEPPGPALSADLFPPKTPSTLGSYLSSQHLRSDAASRSYSVGLLWIPIWLVFFGRTLEYLLSHPLNKRRGESGSLLRLPSRSHFDISQPTSNNIPWPSGLNIPQNSTILPCARLDHAGITLRSPTLYHIL